MGKDKLPKPKEKEGKVIVGLTDKSEKYYAIPEDDFREEAIRNIGEDRETSIEEMEGLEEKFNMCRTVWRKTFNLGENHPNQSSRIISTLKSSDIEAPNLLLLLKDHKKVKNNGTHPARPLCLAS